ncbi:hypothetical protein FAZ15_16875 [Sphingobacterium olei]|uniref:Enoyl reductase (ER) domain-containing protein n=1 Tax=Sphingobacterium olei TaxID=2571155 RepID=A0A4U0NHW2_9SPHI|nr:zinc-binding dehydrogenase [Sphingobacterium olei]TJZ53700.1 hypothetical protein FAZ15_16875 [Sphingobacterium olei]
MSNQEKNPSGVFHGVHDIRVDNLPFPEVTADAVLIKVAMAGICGSDIHFYHQPMVPEGSVLGHEFCGTIVEVGTNVTEFSIGTRVVVNPTIQGTGLGSNPGGFADYVLINNAKLGIDVFPIPETISDEQGAMMEPLSVGLSAVNLAQVKTSDNVVIFGAGTIGLTVLASLGALDVKNVVISDISDARLEIARTLGAKYTFNPIKDGDISVFLKETFGKTSNLFYQKEIPNVQVVFDCAGVPAIFAQGIEILAPKGQYIVLAIYSKKAEIDPLSLVNCMLSIKGILAFSSAEMQQAIELVAAGKIDLTPIVSHRFALSKLPEAFEVQADSKLSVKVLVRPGS